MQTPRIKTLALVAVAALSGVLTACPKAPPTVPPTRPDDLRADPRPPDGDALTELVEAALPEQITGDNRELVRRLQAARLGAPLSRTFDPDRVVAQFFEGHEPTWAPDCEERDTAAGDPDPGACGVSSGEVAGAGAFRELRFSKHLGRGSVSFLSREAERQVEPGDLRPVTLSDKEAYRRATGQLIDTFGLPTEEIPAAPQDARNPLPVRNVAVGWGNPSGIAGSVPVMKIVSIRRGLYVGLDGLPWVPAPGRATVVLDDRGASQVLIRGWQELRPHPRVAPEAAKSRGELVAEIVDDLRAVNDGPVARMRSTLAVAAVPAATYGLMVPSLVLSVSPLPAELDEEAQARAPMATAGYLREYSLVRLDEGKGEEE